MKKLWFCLASVLLAGVLVFSPASAVFSPHPFRDVKEEDWFSGAVAYTYQQGLFHGVSADRFEPNGVVTRAMVVTVLANLSGVKGEEASEMSRHYVLS